MIVIKVKDVAYNEAVVNEDNINYIIPTQDGYSIIYFSDQKYLITTEPYYELKEKLTKPVIFPNIVTQPSITSGGVSLCLQTSSNEDDLPRLPNGNIDKRTVQYKEFIQNQKVG